VSSRFTTTIPKQIRIRRAREDDHAALVALENSVFSSDRMSTRQWRHHLRNPGAEILVAARASDIVAAAVLFFRPGSHLARLYSIAVSAAARGFGVGARLLAAAERAARARGCVALRLEVRSDNPAARSLYERRGYERFGVRKNYYEDGQDALRYEKTLARPHRPTLTRRR
jgi:ribosomal-protein-alanine N-acetyltransferase